MIRNCVSACACTCVCVRAGSAQDVHGRLCSWPTMCVCDTLDGRRGIAEFPTLNSCCLRFKATSQLAHGHSTCGELPKHLTTQQPPLSSMQPTPTHSHYQATTTHHLFFIGAIHSRFQYCFNAADVCVCALLV